MLQAESSESIKEEYKVLELINESISSFFSALQTFPRAPLPDTAQIKALTNCFIILPVQVYSKTHTGLFQALNSREGTKKQA